MKDGRRKHNRRRRKIPGGFGEGGGKLLYDGFRIGSLTLWEKTLSGKSLRRNNHKKRRREKRGRNTVGKKERVEFAQ